MEVVFIVAIVFALIFAVSLYIKSDYRFTIQSQKEDEEDVNDENIKKKESA